MGASSSKALPSSGSATVTCSSPDPDHTNPTTTHHVERKNGDVVCRNAYYYRYDTAGELQLLNESYRLVRVQLNMFSATTKAVHWRSNKHGKKTRVYDKPRTPYQRVLDSRVLAQERATELAQLFEDTNPAELTRRITAIQTRLFSLAKDKTEALTVWMMQTCTVANAHTFPTISGKPFNHIVAGALTNTYALD